MEAPLTLCRERYVYNTKQRWFRLSQISIDSITCIYLIKKKNDPLEEGSLLGLCLPIDLGKDITNDH